MISMTRGTGRRRKIILFEQKLGMNALPVKRLRIAGEVVFGHQSSIGMTPAARCGNIFGMHRTLRIAHLADPVTVVAIDTGGHILIPFAEFFAMLGC